MTKPSGQIDITEPGDDAEAALRRYDQWVAWRYLERGNGKRTKPPVSPSGGRLADVANWLSWSSLDAARRYAAEHRLPGVGFVLTPEDPFCVIDLDGCLVGGQLAGWAADLVARLDTYTEHSPSGAGLHIWAKGRWPGPGNRKNGIEVYDQARYVTWTGQRLGPRKQIEDRDQVLAELAEELFGEPVTTATQPAPASPTLDDLEIIERAMQSKVGQRFARLWLGDAGGYPSQSEADMALAAYLAFYTQDPGQIERIIRTAPAGQREKWQRADYAAATIERAIASRSGTYDPNWRAVHDDITERKRPGSGR